MAENNTDTVARKKCRSCSFEADTYQARNEHEAASHFNNNVSVYIYHVYYNLMLSHYSTQLCFDFEYKYVHAHYVV